MKTGNDLVAEQVRYSTCFCYLPNCANQHNFATLQRIAVLLPDSSIGCIDSFLSLHRAGIYRCGTFAAGTFRTDDNGTTWIYKPREKTAVMSRIPLLPYPMILLEKYERDAELRATGKLLPVPSNQKMNAYLKEIADICNIPKNLTTHVARHTFACLAVEYGMPIDVLAKILGHSNTNMTRHYAKFSEQLIGREMRKMNEQMFSDDVFLLNQ